MGELRLDLCVDALELLGSLLLITQTIGLLQGRLGDGLNFGDQGLVFRRRLPIPLGLSCLLNQPMNRINGMTHLLMAVDNAPKHDLLRELIGLGLDHQYRRLRTRNNQIHLRCLELGCRWVQHILPTDVSHPRGTNWSIERHAGDRHGSGRSNHGGNIRINLWVQ